VVTLRSTGAASLHSHNVSASILIQAGLEELVADTEEDYMRIALDLAGVRVLLRLCPYGAVSLGPCLFLCMGYWCESFLFMCHGFSYNYARAESRAVSRNAGNATRAHAQVAAHGRSEGGTRCGRSL
jgi:hypothetical protein